MAVETDLRTYLLAQATITAIVGSSGVYCGNVPQAAATPLLLVSRVAGEHGHHLDGGAGYCTARVQVDCYSTTYVAAAALAEAVRLKMQGYRGAMGTTTVSSVMLESDLDQSDPPTDASDSWLYRRILDFGILYQNTPTAF